ncbi:MAG TPA: hypothetical protein VF484_01240 [Candidatus Limnocylindrales bacterium]
MRRTSGALLRAALMAVTGLALSGGVVSAGSGPNSPNACGQYGTVINFTMPLPSSIRTPGTHQYEFRSTWTPEFAGDPGEEIDANSVTFDNAAPVYPGTAFVRLFYLMVQLPDGSVSFDVTTLNPSQAGQFAASWFPADGDKVFASSVQVSVRWETSAGTWSDWTTVSKGPQTSVCAPGGVNHLGGFFKRAWGWGG